MNADQAGRAVALAELLRHGWSPKAVFLAAQMLDERREPAEIIAAMQECDRTALSRFQRGDNE